MCPEKDSFVVAEKCCLKTDSLSHYCWRWWLAGAGEAANGELQVQLMTAGWKCCCWNRCCILILGILVLIHCYCWFSGGAFLYAESAVQQLKTKFLLLVVFKNVGKLTGYEIFLFINFNAVIEMQNNFLEQEQVVCMTEHIKSRWFLLKISCRKMDHVWLVWSWWQSNQNLTWEECIE